MAWEVGLYGQLAGIFGYGGVAQTTAGNTGVTIGVGVQSSVGIAATANYGLTITGDFTFRDTNLNPYSQDFDFPFLDFALGGDIAVGAGTPTGLPGFALAVYKSPRTGATSITAGAGVAEIAEAAGYLTLSSQMSWTEPSLLSQSLNPYASAATGLRKTGYTGWDSGYDSPSESALSFGSSLGSPGYTSDNPTVTGSGMVGAGAGSHNGMSPPTYTGTSSWFGGGDTPKETNLGGLLKPVVIDLSPAGATQKEDGLQFFTLWNSPVFFNSDDDVYRERTAWVGPDEGIVVHDVGNDGKVASYTEVALSASDEAKAAGAISDMDALLKLYDTGYDKDKNGTIDADEGKGDKIITAGEADRNHLKIWRDADLDGLVDAGEMVSFAVAGITEIDLTAFNSPALDGDNDGQKDPEVLTRFSDGSTIYNTATVKMTNGSTTAYDIGFAHETVGMYEKKDVDGNVLYVKLERNVGISSAKWVYKTADVDGEAVSWNFDTAEFDTYYGGSGTDGNDRMTFTGSQRRSFSGGGGSDVLSGGKGDDFLIGGTGRDKLLGGAGNDVLYIDAEDTAVDDLIDGGDGYDVLRVNSSAGVTIDLKTVNAEAFFGNDGNDVVRATGDVTGVIMSGGGGNDLLYGGSGNDVQIGGDGADRLSGGSGNDTMIGGEGVDRLYGGNGDDLIYADENDSFDGIDGGDGFDVLVIDDSVDKTQVFATVLNLVELGFEAAVGGDGNDSFTVTTEEDTFLYGAGGNDFLRTGAGGDLLAGGKGNDTLDGNGGSDLYLFNRGDGDDKISEGIVVASDGNGGMDTIGFGADIDVDDLQFQRVDSDLVISLRTENKTTLSGETIRVVNWSSTANQVELLAFNDGTVLDISGARFTTLETGDDSNADLDAGTSTLDSVGASTRLDIIDAGEGNDIVFAWAGNDIVLGRLGNDHIHGGDGHDYLDGGYGNDILYGDAGDDTLIGGKDSVALARARDGRPVRGSQASPQTAPGHFRGSGLRQASGLATGLHSRLSSR